MRPLIKILKCNWIPRILFFFLKKIKIKLN